MRALSEIQSRFKEAIFKNEEPCLGMQIHRNNIYSKLRRALQEAYPNIQRLVGEEFFTFIANQYVKYYPSCSYNLIDYGQFFPDFIQDYPSAQSLPYLKEVATLEWACHSAYYKPCFFALFKFKHPISSIMRLCQHKNFIVDLSEGGERILVFKYQHEVYFKKLSAFRSFLCNGIRLVPYF